MASACTAQKVCDVTRVVCVGVLALPCTGLAMRTSVVLGMSQVVNCQYLAVVPSVVLDVASTALYLQSV
jgi:hypothetical protein